MPQGKKKPGASNNKKKKKYGGQAGHGQNSDKSPVAVAVSDDFSSVDLNTTNWNGYFESESSATPKDRVYKSLYVRYKLATERFKESLRAMVPPDIFASNSVNTLMEAVDYLASSTDKKIIPESMLKDLKLSIRVRRRVAEGPLKGGDSGHSYFLSTLVYCFVVLRTLQPEHPRSTKKGTKTLQHKTNDRDPDTNHFAALSVEDDDDDDDDEADLPSGPIIRPVPSEPVRLTLDELIHGSDRQDAILFLMTLDQLMEFNAEQYSKLKMAWSSHRSEGWPPLTIIEHLMETTVVANFGIQYVQFLEQKLAADHPHMDTIYRLMSVLVFPELSRELVNDMTDKSPLASQFKESDASTFLGDCLEKAVRNESDSTMKYLAADFCRKWQVPSKMVEDRIAMVRLATIQELPVHKSLEMNQQMLNLARGMGFYEYSWLPNSEFIGTDKRYILLTVKLLQGLSNVIQDRQGHLLMRKGFFGKPWDESKQGVATRISRDMDEFLMGDVLVYLINACHGGLLAQRLPREEELMPFFARLKDFVKNPMQPVSWSLAFAVHTLLTSVFEMQGNNDVHSLAETAKTSFELYFDQIEKAERMLKGKSQPRDWSENLKRIQLLKWLVVPPTLKPDRVATLRAFWNPLCAGSFLCYIAYFSNLEQGSWMVDSFAQLRIVLHLYNALKDVGLLPPEGREILGLLDDQFKNSKAIWEGLQPSRGDFVRRFWISYGTELKEAQRRSRETASKYGVESTGFAAEHRVNTTTARQMTPMEPSKLAKSFRRIMNNDFTDVVDSYHPTASHKTNPLYDHAVRCNDTLDAMEADQRYLAMNMTSIGAHLNAFIMMLSDALEWQPSIEKLLATLPDEVRFDRRTDGRRIGRSSWEASDDNLERQAIAAIFADRILGKLDFQDLTYPDTELARTIAVMNVFFGNLDPASTLYFVPVEEQE